MKSKNTIRWVTSTFLFIIAIICLVVGVKHKNGRVSIETSSVLKNPIYEDGYCYRFATTPYPLLGFIKLDLHENNTRLEPVRINQSSEIFNSGKGIFAYQDQGFSQRFIYFAPSDNSDPRINGRDYVLVYKIIDLSPKRVFLLSVSFLLVSLLILFNKITTQVSQFIFSKLLSVFIHHKKVCLLGLILFVSITLHVINILSSPLISEPDTYSYLAGAVSFAHDLNYNGVYDSRGPGVAMIFGPIYRLFGEHSTWPSIVVLHSMAIGAVLFTFFLAHKMSNNLAFAFISGMMAAVWPDLYYYSNDLLSEVPVCFSIIAFLYFAAAFLIDKKYSRLFFASLFLALSILIRTENLLLALIFFVAVGFSLIKQYGSFKTFLKSSGFRNAVMCGMVCILPVFWWALHNQRLHGFFGLTNYTDMVFYEGTINATHSFRQNPPLVNTDSPAVQKIKLALSEIKGQTRERYPEIPENYPATGKDVFIDSWALREYYGLTRPEISAILYQAVFDSIRAKPFTFLQLLMIKVNYGLHVDCCSQIGYRPIIPELNDFYKDNKDHTVNFPGLKKFQLFVFEKLYYTQFGRIYWIWRWICVGAIFYILLIKPAFHWKLFAVFTLINPIFFLMISIGIPRYTIPGNFPLNICGLVLLMDLLMKMKQIVAPMGRKMIGEIR